MAHILLPTDLSEEAMHAASLTVDLFGPEGNRFTLLHAFGAAGFADPLLPDMIPDLQVLNDQAVREFELRLRAKRDLSRAEVRSLSMFGPLSSVVNEAVKHHAVDLVVMSSSGRHGGAFLGSNTTDVMRTARVPVLELPKGASTPAFERILFADDRSVLAAGSLDVLGTIARRSNAEVILVHVATGKPAKDQVDNSALFQRVFSGLRTRTLMVENDDVASALLDVAGREKAGLIALVHRHAGAWAALFHASTTKAVALHSAVPVLALEQ